MTEAKEKFYKEFPSQKNTDYLEIHSPLSNYAIDRENQKIVETPNNNTNNTMKKINILNIFKKLLMNMCIT